MLYAQFYHLDSYAEENVALTISLLSTHIDLSHLLKVSNYVIFQLLTALDFIIWSARFSADIRLLGLATPRLAISRAVP